MVRPKKSEDEKRKHKITINLTDEENEFLTDVALNEKLDKTKLVYQALGDWFRKKRSEGYGKP